MKHRSGNAIIMAALAALPCAAQQVRFGGPLAGLVFDPPSRSLRAVLGMPGAARMSNPVLDEAAWASVAPNGRTVIVQRQGRFTAATVTSSFEQLELKPILGAEVIASSQLAAWSADSSAAVLYSASTKSAQWIRIATSGALADPAIPAGIEGEVTAMAAASPGLAVLAVAGQGVYRLTPNGSLHLVLPVEDPSAIAIDPSGQTLWAADRGQSQILRVANLASTPETGVAAIDQERLSDVSALGLSSSGKQLYAASRKTQRIHVMDISNGSLEAGAQLDAEATSFLPFGRSSLMLLGQRSQTDGPLYLFDEISGGSVFFVPAAGDSAQ